MISLLSDVEHMATVVQTNWFKSWGEGEGEGEVNVMSQSWSMTQLASNAKGPIGISTSNIGILILVVYKIQFLVEMNSSVEIHILI